MSAVRNLLYVCHLTPNKQGAYETFLVELSRQSSERGIAVRLILEGHPIEPVARQLRAAGATWDIIPNWTNDRGRQRISAFVRCLAPQLRSFDVVAFNFCDEAPVALLGTLSKPRVRSVWVQHSQISPAAGIRRVASRMRVLKYVVDRFVAISAGARAAMVRRGCPASAVKVIYNGVRPPAKDPTRPQIRRELGLSDDCRLILSVGSLISRKGHDVLLRSAAASLNPETQLLIVGHGPLRDDLEGLARRLNIHPFVHFLGHRDDVPCLIDDCQVFALASHREGLTLAVIEAMASGIPVVTTDAGGHGEVISDGVNGWLVPPCDEASLAHALQHCLTDPERAAAVGRRGRETVSRMCNLESCVAAHLDWYCGA